MRAGKAQFVELEQSEIGLLARCNRADVITAQARRRTSSGHRQCIEVCERVRALARQPIHHQRMAHSFHHVRTVIGRRAINPEAYRCPVFL